MGFFRQEYWSVVPWSPPGDLPDLGTESWSSVLQADSSPSEPPGKAPVPSIPPDYCPFCLYQSLNGQNSYFMGLSLQMSTTLLKVL